MRAPILHRLGLMLVVCLASTGVIPAGLAAQEATPDAGVPPLAFSTDPDRVDLAAMALTMADVPNGYVGPDAGYYLTPRGVSMFLFGESITAEDIAATNLVSMYDSFFYAMDGGQLFSYIAQFPSEEDLQAGFDLMEDESLVPEYVSAVDSPVPAIGEEPSEMTLAVVDFRAFEGPIVEEMSITFSIGTLLVIVGIQTPIDEGGMSATPVMADTASATPDPEVLSLVEGLATTLAGRIEAVQAGEDVGVDQTLPSMLLPTDTLWSRPGYVNEGYRSATDILGPEGPAAEFADAYQGGYVRIIAGAPVPDVVFPHRPLVNITVTHFDSADTAMQVLDVAESIPSPPFFFEEPLEEVDGNQIEGVDATRTYTGSFRVGEPADSVRIAFTSGEYLVFVDVFGNTTVDDAMAIATDIAGQQAACTASGQACTEVTAPEILPPNHG